MSKRNRATELPPQDTPVRRFPRGRALLLISLPLTILFVAILLVKQRQSPAAMRGAPDIVLVTIDTLRADALGFAGNRRVRTPFLDELARDGRVFTNAHAHNVVTLPSHANILTGLYPYQHGIRDNAGFVLDVSHPTVAKMLKTKGYVSGGFVGAYPLDSRFGLSRDFDAYDDRYHEGSTPLDFAMDERRASEVIAAARSWYESVRDRKKFLWLHLYDPHAPYSPPPPFDTEFRDDRYLGEISYVDRELEQFLRPILEASPNTLVIVTADHGEALGDHGEQTHGLFAYEATLKVPLIVYRKGGIDPKQDDRLARHIDIVPTILSEAGIAAPEGLRGENLLGSSSGGESYFEALTSFLSRGWAPLTGVIREGNKYIELPLPELYSLRADPRELRNLYENDRRTVARLRQTLATIAPKATEIAQPKISNEEQARLLALGYLTGSSERKETGPDDDPKNLVGLDSKMHRVVDQYQRGEIEQAVVTATEVVKERPGMASAYDMLAFVLQQAERLSDAAEVLRSAIRSGTRTEQMEMRLGMILSEMGKADEALKVLGPYKDRDDPDLLNAYGIALADTGRIDEGLRTFERVLEVDDTNAKALQNYGIIALRAGRLESAEQHLNRALALNDRLPLSLNALGVLRARRADYNGAMEMWGKAVSLDQRQYDAMFNLALVAGQQRRWDVCRRALDQFIATAPPKRYARDIEKAKAMRAEAGYRMKAERGS